MFGKDLDKLVGSSYTAGYLNNDHQSLCHSIAAPVGITFGLKTRLRNSMRLLMKPDVLEHSAPRLEEPELLGPLFHEDGPFGRGLLLSDLGGVARVTTVNGDVAANVFGSVLNASSVLDVDHAGDGRLFHFLKPNEESFSADLAEVRRLSGAYNVTTGDGARGRGRKICAARGGDAAAAAAAAKVCLLYGVDARAAARQLQRSARKAAVADAWQRESARAKLGVAADRWSQSQLAELARRGEVRGFTGVEVQSVNQVPALIGHGSNIMFVRDGELLKHQRRPIS